MYGSRPLLTCPRTRSLSRRIGQLGQTTYASGQLLAERQSFRQFEAVNNKYSKIRSSGKTFPQANFVMLMDQIHERSDL